MKKIFLLMLCLMLFIALGACATEDINGNGVAQPQNGSAQDDQNESGTGETATQTGNRHLVWTFWGSAFERDEQMNAAAAFADQFDDVTVEALHIPAAGGEYVARISAMTAAGQAPDVGRMDPAVAFVWAQDGVFWNIFDLIDNDPEWSREMYVDHLFYMYAEGRAFGSTSSINPRAIFYNVEAFREAGVDTPPLTPETAWQWNEFVDVAKQLTIDMDGRNAHDPDFDSNRTLQYGVYFNPDDLEVLAIFLDSNQVDLLTEDGNSLDIGNPRALEVFQAYHDLIYLHNVMPIPNDFTAMPDGPMWLATRQTAMLITGQWVLLDLANHEVDFGIGHLPYFVEPRNMKGAGTQVVFSCTEYPELAWELLKWTSWPGSALNLFSSGLLMPIFREWYDDPELFAQWGENLPARPDSYRTVIVDSLFNGTATPNWVLRINNFNEIWNMNIRSPLQQIWLDSQSVEDTIEEILAAFPNDIIRGFNPDNHHIMHYRP